MVCQESLGYCNMWLKAIQEGHSGRGDWESFHHSKDSEFEINSVRDCGAEHPWYTNMFSNFCSETGY